MASVFDPALFPDRLNLGCGYDHRHGYLNVDINDFHSPDLVADVTNLHMLPADGYREILAQDVLEHLPRTATVEVLLEWNRLLSVGGTLHLRLPSVVDLVALLKAPENQSVEMQEKLIQCLFGTQAYSEDTHLTTFTEPLLRHYLDEAGFAVVNWRLRDEWLFEVDAEKVRSVVPAAPPQHEDAAKPRDPEPERLSLRELIETAKMPPPQGHPGPVKRATRSVLLEMGRPNAVHQQRIDLEILRRLEALDQSKREIQGWLQATSDRGDETAGHMIELERELRAAIAELEHRVARTSKLVPDDTPLYGDGAFRLERFDAGLGGSVVGFRDRSDGDSGETLYAAFEDYFRGPEEEIRERQSAYLQLLEGRRRILDVGCGRGEFLELMRQAGIEAEGIDIDAAMIEHCRSKGLDNVRVGDAVGYLEGVSDHSLGAVFAAQVIEHLPYEQLVRFLRAARDKLEPAGLLVLESVNPHAPQGMKNFWIDPTHCHPLFPETVIALCGLTGFAGAFVWYPQGSGDPDRDRTQQLDYAVVAEAVGTEVTGGSPPSN